MKAVTHTNCWPGRKSASDILKEESAKAITEGRPLITQLWTPKQPVSSIHDVAHEQRIAASHPVHTTSTSVQVNLANPVDKPEKKSLMQMEDLEGDNREQQKIIHYLTQQNDEAKSEIYAMKREIVDRNVSQHESVKEADTVTVSL